MIDNLLELFREYPNLAILISIVTSIVIAVLGVVPSVFVTAANVLFFGFWTGTLLSFIGEAIGAAIAFILYRKGFKRAVGKGLDRYPKIKQLINADGKEAFYLVFVLRLIPFVPSGLVTFAAAVGRMGLMIFIMASSIGKLPALLIEAYSVYKVAAFDWQGKLILAAIALGCLYWLIIRKRKK